MLRWALILLLTLRRLACDESAEATRNDTIKVSTAEETTESLPQPVTEVLPTLISEVISPTENVVSPTFRVQGSPRPRRRPRRPRGFYNDIRYRNPANNPYNPNSPYAFRGRPGQPPMVQRQQSYSDPYYDPYNQYYGYQGYAPVQPMQQQYYPYPYQPQPRIPQTPPPTETIPDLYYVQKADSPDGQYQYKKVSVLPDGYPDNRGRRRPTRWSQQPYGHPAGGYYNYPYDNYEGRPPPQQPYYQPYPYPQQYPPYYQYPKVPGGPRSRLRSGRPPLRSTASPGEWRLTLAPFTTATPDTDPHPSSDPSTEPSGD